MDNNSKFKTEIKQFHHRGHRGIIVLQKRKNTENTEKKTNRNSVLSVVKKPGVVLCGLCGLYPEVG